MWKAATIILTSATIASLIAIELVRSIVHRRRERRDGIGGTQDVAIVGAAITLLLAIAALVSMIMWTHGREAAAAPPPPSTQPMSTTAPSPRPADHLDVIEVVFRHLIVTYAPVTDSDSQFVFLMLGDRFDPPKELMERLGDDKRVVPISKSVPSRAPVAHVDGTGHGVVLGVGTIAWLNEREAEVTAGWYHGPLAAGGNRYRLERRDGKWVVTRETSIWIS